MRDLLETGGSFSTSIDVTKKAALAHKCLNWMQSGSWVNIWVKYHHLFAVLLLPEASAIECRDESGQTFGLTQSCCSSALTTPAIMPCLLGLEQHDSSNRIPVVSLLVTVSLMKTLPYLPSDDSPTTCEPAPGFSSGVDFHALQRAIPCSEHCPHAVCLVSLNPAPQE